MLTTRDPAVQARINLHAVLGSLPTLVRTVPRARAILQRVERPTTLHVLVAGGPRKTFAVTPTGITAGRTVPGTRVALLCASPGHFNAVIQGRSTALPVAGPAGVRFLRTVFQPLAELLGAVLLPEACSDDLLPESVRAQLLLAVALAATEQVANHDRSGRYTCGLLSDGCLAVEVGPDTVHHVAVREHRLHVVQPSATPPRAALRFADLDVAGAVLSGRVSAMACLGDGRVALRGFIPLIDGFSRILDRVGFYLRK
ncbi:MAG TPA: hypothetical protein VFP72_07750 [Kineosporiaceae bacterium]|nr:hypothetical protein [Kineosporiaceae bacterium]